MQFHTARRAAPVGTVRPMDDSPALVAPAAAPARPAARRPSVLMLAWRQLWRDWRAGELRLLMLAVALAVAAVCAVSFLADRLDQGLRRDAAQMLGGDVVVASDQPTPPKLRELAQAQGLTAVDSTAFPSMARATDAQGGASRLVAVKAVGAGYPLRGRVELSDGRRVGAPAAGEVWVDAQVLDALGLRPGDTLLLGEASLRVAGVIANEPDRGAGFMSFAPRVMLAQADLAATALIQPASRVTYRYAVIAPDGGAGRASQDWQRYSREAAALIASEGWRGVRLESLESGRPEMRQTLDRAGKFLNLVAMLAALLAAVAVVLSARDFAARHLDDCAMLRVLGQPQRRLAWAYGLEFGGAGLVASVAGVLLGFALHYAFVALLAGLIEVKLPAASGWPVALGLGMGMTLLLGFGLPPVLQLAAVPPLRVIRRELGSAKLGSLAVLGAGVLGFGAMLVTLSADPTLGLIASLGFAAALALFALLAWGAVLLLRRLVPQAGAPRWLLLATRQLAARPLLAVVQVAALAVGLLALALLVLLRTDLIASWRQATPANAPNRFIINIQPEQGEAMRAALEGAGVHGYDWYPMIRGRLVGINGQAVRPEQFAQERAQRLAEREFNLSHAAELPQHNQVVGGRWQNDEADGLSVEQGLAEQLGLKLGDRLRFDVAGIQVEARITSLRKVDWSSMRANFFVIFPRKEMGELPGSYITAYRAPAAEAGLALDKRLSHEFPNITAVDVSAQLNQMQAVLGQVINAVQFLFMFTLATGLVVLLAAVSSTRELRTREFALMRALGASSALLRQVQRAELLGLGALAGLLAGAVALLLGQLLARYVFEFDWRASPWVPLASMVCGALLAQLAGWWSLRNVLLQPVVTTLRQADTQ